MAGARANIRAEISADTTKFQGAMRRAQTVAQATGSKIGQSMAGARAGMNALASQALKAGAAIGAMAVAIGGAAIVKGLKMAADLAGRLTDISNQTGLAQGSVALLERAFDDAGIAVDKVAPTINKMQKAIVGATTKGGAMADTFAGLGLDLGELSKMSPEAQFAAIGNAIDKIEDPAQRAAVAMQIFGKSGGELLGVFGATGTLGDAAKNLGTQSEILNRQSGTFDRISDILGRVGSKMQGFFVGMLDRIADPVLALLERFDGLDLAAIGQRAGDALKVAVNWSLQLIEDVVYWGETFLHWIKIAGVAIAALFTPSFWASVGYSAQALFMDMGNFAIGFLNGLKDGWIQFVISGFKFWVSVFQEFMKPDFWSGLLDVFKGIAFGFAGAILEAVAKGLELIEKIPGVKRFLGENSGKLREMAAGFDEKSKASMDEGGDTLDPIFKRIGEKAKEAAGEVGNAFKDGFEKGSGTIDSQSVKDKAIDAMMPVADAMADVMAGAPVRRKIADAAKKLIEPFEKTAEDVANAADGANLNNPVIPVIPEMPAMPAMPTLSPEEIKASGVDPDQMMTSAAGMSTAEISAKVLANRELVKAGKLDPNNVMAPVSVLGGDDVFAKARANRGVASEISTGGLVAKRKFGEGQDTQNKKQENYAAKQVSLLEDIETNISAALTVA